MIFVTVTVAAFADAATLADAGAATPPLRHVT